MLPEIIEYSGNLSFPALSPEQLDEARRLAEESRLEIDLGPTYLEFEYSGRDTNRRVVNLLANLSRVIGDARGEVVCKLVRDDGDPDFEFYSINDGRLMRQRGRIVRDHPEAITTP